MRGRPVVFIGVSVAVVVIAAIAAVWLLTSSPFVGRREEVTPVAVPGTEVPAQTPAEIASPPAARPTPEAEAPPEAAPAGAEAVPGEAPATAPAIPGATPAAGETVEVPPSAIVPPGEEAIPGEAPTTVAAIPGATPAAEVSPEAVPSAQAAISGATPAAGETVEVPPGAIVPPGEEAIPGEAPTTVAAIPGATPAAEASPEAVPSAQAAVPGATPAAGKTVVAPARVVPVRVKIITPTPRAALAARRPTRPVVGPGIARRTPPPTSRHAARPVSLRRATPAARYVPRWRQPVQPPWSVRRQPQRYRPAYQGGCWEATRSTMRPISPATPGRPTVSARRGQPVKPKCCSRQAPGRAR